MRAISLSGSPGGKKAETSTGRASALFAGRGRRCAGSTRSELRRTARANLAVQRDVGRRDDPHIDRKRAFGPEDLHLALLERPEKLSLRWKGKVDDLVEEQGPTLSQLEVPLPSPVRPGERALLVAEQFRLDQRFGNRAAVHSHEGLLAAGTALVDRARHQLFPCPVLALV